MFAYVRRRAARLVTGAVAASLAAGIQLAKGQSTDELFIYPGTKLAGKVSVQANVPQAQCRSLCTSRSGCLGFDFSSSGSVAACRLYEKVDSALDSPAHTAGTRSLVAGYRPPSNPPVQPAASAPLPEPSAPEAPDASGRKVSYRPISGDPRDIGWVYINVCLGAPVDAASLRKSVNDFVYQSLRLIPARLAWFDRSTTPQCAAVPKAIGYVSSNADGWRIEAALKEMGPLLRPLGIGTRADGKLPAGDPDRYRIDIWLSHQ